MIHHGDSLEVLRTFEADSVDAVITDPPYGWRFMGKAWDAPDIAKVLERDKTLESDDKTTLGMAAGKYNQSLKANKSFQLWTEAWAKEALRVLKPGGHALIFCGPRTYHRMAAGVEDAGFEIRDQLQWLFGSGFPKSHNIGEGRGTALKPANEPIVLARKPLSESTVAKNVLKWGTGALNIDASRIGYASEADKKNNTEALARFNSTSGNSGTFMASDSIKPALNGTSQGRWPANVLFEEAGMLKSGSGNKNTSNKTNGKTLGNGIGKGNGDGIGGDSGGASRFFYCAKASKSERNKGLEGMPEVSKSHLASADGGGGGWSKDSIKNPNLPRANHHPTVKPVKLMEYLCRLITPTNGIILDPFMGSGSTGVAAKRLGFKFIGIEMNEEYIEIAKRRIDGT